MTNTYDVGDLIQVTGTFTNSAGTATDPTAVAFIVTDPDGTDTGYHVNLSSQGNWNASTNTPTLADGTGTAGHYYTANVAGSVDLGHGSITFVVNDYVYYNGYVWQRLPSPSATAVTKSATGIYTVNVYASKAGVWQTRGEGVGTGQSAGELEFIIRQRKVS